MNTIKKRQITKEILAIFVRENFTRDDQECIIKLMYESIERPYWQQIEKLKKEHSELFTIKALLGR